MSAFGVHSLDSDFASDFTYEILMDAFFNKILSEENSEIDNEEVLVWAELFYKLNGFMPYIGRDLIIVAINKEITEEKLSYWCEEVREERKEYLKGIIKRIEETDYSLYDDAISNKERKLIEFIKRQ